MNLSVPVNYISTNFAKPTKSKEFCAAKPYPNDVFIKTTSFKGNEDNSGLKLKRGQLLGEDGKIYTRAVTSMFRSDLNWGKFKTYLQKRFMGCDKVNTYVYACSDGSEAYSLSVLLQEAPFLDEESFFPIKAKDINPETIKKAIENQTGERKTRNEDYISGRFALGLNQEKMQKYMEIETDENNRETVRLTERVVAPVEFSEANILDDVKNIDSKNPSIVNCLNMWPYVNAEEYENFAAKLFEKLAPGSIVVVGEFDYKGDGKHKDSDKFPESLLKAGFEPSESNTNFCHNLIFEKN